MIRYIKGNLLDDTAEAVVNTVNEVGVMGKGIALMFKERFPENTEIYERACKDGKVRVGEMLVVEMRNLWGPRWVINFPTKRHWRHPSKIEWIRDGLRDLVRAIKTNRIRSIAIPPLGCGNGGLDWLQVQREIELAMANLPEVEVRVYIPTSTYQNVSKREGVLSLTPARALIAEMVRRYSVMGLECSNLEVQKLAWFLTRTITERNLPNPLKLTFEAHIYGPYSDQLRHMLNGLDGSYLHCDKRLADAGPLDLIWFEDKKRSVVESYLHADAVEYLPALEATAAVIDGFESPLGMELLSTVDWLLTKTSCEPTVEAIRDALANWPGGESAGRRKLRIFDSRLIALAIQRLTTTPLR